MALKINILSMPVSLSTCIAGERIMHPRASKVLSYLSTIISLIDSQKNTTQRETKCLMRFKEILP